MIGERGATLWTFSCILVLALVTIAGIFSVDPNQPISQESSLRSEIVPTPTPTPMLQTPTPIPTPGSTLVPSEEIVPNQSLVETKRYGGGSRWVSKPEEPDETNESEGLELLVCDEKWENCSESQILEMIADPGNEGSINLILTNNKSANGTVFARLQIVEGAEDSQVLRESLFFTITGSEENITASFSELEGREVKLGTLSTGEQKECSINWFVPPDVGNEIQGRKFSGGLGIVLRS